MAEDLINSIVDRGVVGKQITETTAELAALQKQLVDTANSAIVLNNAIGKANSNKSYERAANDAAVATEKLRQAQLKTEEAAARLALQQQRLEQATIRTEEATNRQAAASEKASNAARKQAGAYEILNAAYREATEVARNAGVVFGENSTQFQNAARSANFLRERLDAVDRPLGNFQRNVGNYRSGFDGLGNSINQLTREFPAFAVSAQTGILALSNNIPIFFDQIQRTRAEVAALRADGQVTAGTFSRLITSLFSFGTILSVGVTLLTIYGKEVGNFVKALFKGKEALDLFAERQKAVNDVFKSSNKEIAQQTTQLKYLYESATDVNNAMDERLQSAKKLQETFPKTFGLQEAENIINGEAIKIYNSLTTEIIKNAKAKAAANRIADEEAKILDADIQKQKIQIAQQYETNRAIDLNVKALMRQGLTYEQARKKVIENQAVLEKSALGGLGASTVTKSGFVNGLDVINKRAQDSINVQDQIIKRANINIKAIENLIGSPTAIGNGINDDPTKKDKKVTDKSKSLLDEQLKAIKQAEDLILQSETATLDERLAAVDKFEVDSINLIQKAEDKKTVTVLQANILRNGIGLESGKDRLKIETDAQKAIVDAFNEGSKAITEQEREEITAFKEGQDERLLLIEQYKSDALLALADQYSQGKVSAAEYNQQVYDIENQSAKDRIDVQIETLKRIIALQKSYLEFGTGTQKDLQRSEAELTRFQIQAAELVIKKKLDGIRAEKEARRDLANLERDIANASIDLVKALVEGGFTRKLEALSVERDEINKNAEEEKKAVERSLLSETEKADKQRLIDAKTEQSQKRLADQEKKIKHDQAVFEKVLSAARILQATAIAEVQALTYLSNPFTAPLYPAIAAAIATLGAIQLATVLATPIPAYKEGTEYHKGGLARYGEAGTELILEPNKPAYLTQGDTIGDLPTGTKVISNKKLMNALANPGSSSYVTNQLDLSALLQDNKANTKQLINALSAKQKDTYRVGVRDGAKRSEYLKKNL